jgi:hypothetical protein
MILANLPIHLKRTLIHFLTTDVPHQTNPERPGKKTGYLMKRGKNFGGWKSRYFQIEGPVLEYYDQVRPNLIANFRLLTRSVNPSAVVHI